ncbi:1,2-phenylacetyl-CoA epoxidase subunit PaaD [Spelaeicoccus albus]|uniref:Ring-1,2-phenylacetyl-CoA epoxidase subunit PaaD n=1 Tax=Spelaeicoccus albus TaxID=1280376 RepID=A0A7Z0D292_9MICO|nr:1,2-phenylacetyl-CoA epoxidase subunit PaaD [Spelaeicoccus albus]NYI67531.1 ring-1,2-phenylacetyl-CoA epoxidase subunit PaaD [Spelaeicoccus albus]
MTTTIDKQSMTDSARRAAARVPDPEIPVLSIEDLGILRDVQVEDDVVHVFITPTYSGCPAMDAIRTDIDAELREAGFPAVRVHTVLSPAWTTDWMSDEGKRKLAEYGIAPPSGHSAVHSGPIPVALSVKCPHCGSLKTRELSRFGSTACKALYRCTDCREPFDYFKVH